MKTVVVTENGTGKILFEGKPNEIDEKTRGRAMARMVDLTGQDGIKRMEDRWTVEEKQ